MDEHIYGKIESIFGYSHVHGYDTATKHEVILEQGRLFVSLFNYFKHYDSGPLYRIAEMFSYYQSRNL